MKSRNHSTWRVKAARFMRCLSFLLVPALASEVTPRPRSTSSCATGSTPGADPLLPYLLAVGPPPLRFAQALPLPDVSTRPASAAPPVPAVVEEIAAANAASAKPVGTAPPSPVAPPEASAPEPASVPVAPVETAKPPARTPPALIPDDTQHETRPEEILPFFQLPGSSGGAGGATTIVVPVVPAQPEEMRLPVSTAVYRQH